MKRLFLFLMNNTFTNRILIGIGRDGMIKKYVSNWSKTKIDQDKSLQENVGFSHETVVQEAIEKVHKTVQESYKLHCPSEGSVLDIGCGVGLYLQDFPQGTELAGTDLSDEFTQKAKELLPEANLKTGDFMEIDFPKKFSLIFSISVLEYISPSRLTKFFLRIKLQLETKGVVMIQYPHALSKKHCRYPDLAYVQYSPLKVGTAMKAAGFEIISHKHSYDGRVLNFKFDSKRYDPEKEKSFRNGAIIIGRIS